MQLKKGLVQFDVLLRTEASNTPATLNNIEAFRPDAGDLQICLKWFQQQGMRVYATDFGLAGEATPQAFEALFQVKLAPAAAEDPGPPGRISGDLQVPTPIKAYIDQISLSQPPEMF
jgi:hypothetical protein